MLSHHLIELHKKAHLRLVLAGGIAVVSLATIVYPGVRSWIDTTQHIATLDADITTSQTELTQLRSDYRELTIAYAEAAERDRARIDTVLPDQEYETRIVRAVEDAAREIATRDTMQLRSVKFNTAPRSADDTYDTISFRVSINASDTALDELLRFFETSGNLDEETPTRLYSVTDVSATINNNVDPRLNRGPIDAELTVHAYAFRPRTATAAN